MELRGRQPRRPAWRQLDLRRSRRRWGRQLNLSSRSPEPPGDADRITGPETGNVVVLYADFECARCGLAWDHLRKSSLRYGLRHFPVTSGHPRARAASAAAEAAALQDHFWEMVTLLFADQGRLDPPHLWERAERLGLDLSRFDEDMQREETLDRINSDFRSAIRAGVATTPSFLVNGRLESGVPSAETLQDWAA